MCTRPCAECFVGGRKFLEASPRKPCGTFLPSPWTEKETTAERGPPSRTPSQKGLDLKPGLLREPRLLSPRPCGIPALPPP